MKHINITRLIATAVISALAGVFSAPTVFAQGNTSSTANAGKLTPATIARASFDAAKATQIEKNIATFDDLDFNVFTNQKWDELSHSHSKDVIVHWPDGRITRGIDVHIKDLKALFVFAPDTRILQHPIKIGQGDYTSVVGVFEGTFTKPMPTADGKTIAPTGKAFKILMCTVGHWKNGVMDEEYLFWDNAAFAKQIGLSQ